MLKFTCEHKNIHVFMYFFHLVPPFTSYYIIMIKGLLLLGCITEFTSYIVGTRLSTTVAFLSVLSQTAAEQEKKTSQLETEKMWGTRVEYGNTMVQVGLIRAHHV